MQYQFASRKRLLCLFIPIGAKTAAFNSTADNISMINRCGSVLSVTQRLSGKCICLLGLSLKDRVFIPQTTGQLPAQRAGTRAKHHPNPSSRPPKKLNKHRKKRNQLLLIDGSPSRFSQIILLPRIYYPGLFVPQPERERGFGSGENRNPPPRDGRLLQIVGPAWRHQFGPKTG